MYLSVKMSVSFKSKVLKITIRHITDIQHISGDLIEIICKIFAGTLLLNGTAVAQSVQFLGCRLGDFNFGSRFRCRTRNFLVPNSVKTGSSNQHSSCPYVTGGSFPVVKNAWDQVWRGRTGEKSGCLMHHNFREGTF
jgi:hypothetical protein